MIHCLILVSTIGLPVLWPGPADILETSLIYSWSCSQLSGLETRLLRDGVPILISGHEPVPGWGSFESVNIRSPLEAGVWGTGKWEIDFESFNVPDSSYASGMGLLENTSSRNRYTAYLRRPVLDGFLLDLSISREDTLRNQRIELGWNDLLAGGRGWQTTEDGYTLWTAFQPEYVMTRFAFAHLHSGGRQWEILGSFKVQFDQVEIKTGAAGSFSADSVIEAEGHVRFELPLHGSRIIVRTDIMDSEENFTLGGTAGLLSRFGILETQVGAVLIPGSSVSFIGIAGAGPVELNLGVDSDGFESGLQTLFSTGYGYLQAGTSMRKDTLRFAGTAMPSVRWGASGRIHGGISWELLNTDDRTSGTMDLKSLFTLGNFAFIFALEDVLDDYRSYTFGITWIFDDHPPRPIEEAEEEN